MTIIDRVIKDTRRDIIRKLREERFVEITGKIGFIGTMGSLAIISAVAVCAVLTRFLQMEHIILSSILNYGPGIAASFGTVSSVVTYYGWFRILRGKKKLSAKEEGKSEAQSQLGEFIQSLPDMLGSLSGGCFSQASTAVLGASIAVSTVVYVPAVNEAFNDAVNTAERAVVRTIKQTTEKFSEKPVAEDEQIIETEEAKTELEELEEIEETEEIAEEAEKQRITGKLDLQGGRGDKERAVVELISGNEVAAWAFVDSEGNYSFSAAPGNYTVRARLDGYEAAYSPPFELSNKEMQISKLIITSITPANEYAEPAKPAEVKPVEVKPIETKPAAKSIEAKSKETKPVAKPAETKPTTKTETKKVPAQPTPIVQQKQKSKAPPEEMPLPPEPPPPPKPKKQRQPDEPPPPQADASKSGFFAGAGSELNNNSTRKGTTAMGGNVVLGYDMNKNFALGLNAIYSHDMEAMSTLESMVMVRYYLPAAGSFLQAEAGGALSTTEGKNSTVPLGGLTAGMRLEMENRWYLEPALRGGYPFTWGAGITLGKKFGK